jgi:hypothetical protein
VSPASGLRKSASRLPRGHASHCALSTVISSVPIRLSASRASMASASAS